MARFLESITLTNFLSFGPEGVTLELEDVNVLVGANGSGKSNLLEAIHVLRHAPKDLAQPLREGGGIREYVWRSGRGEPVPTMTLAATIAPGVVTAGKVGYGLELAAGTSGPEVVEEWLFDVELEHAFFRVAGGRLFERAPARVARALLKEPVDTVDSAASVLSQRRDPRGFAEGTKLADRLLDVRIYRNWTVGPACPLRPSRRIDLPTNSLMETFENFPGRLATLKGNPAVKRRLLELLDEVSPGFSDIEIVPEGGALQVYLIEGERKISTYRLSDGTLRYLMLLVVLLDPAPPPLLVIEEPELSLHPDVLPRLRDLLVEAGERTQIIVTTQSPTFLDSWTGKPEVIVVCERNGESTSFERLSKAHTEHGDDGLGVRWNRGEFGGNRW